MSKFSMDRGTGASESAETVPSGSMNHRLVLALTAAGGALLLTVSAWVVLAGGDDALVDTFLPIAADPILTPAPITPGPTGTAAADPMAPTLDPAAGRDPFLPLAVPPVTAAAETGGTTPYPTVTPTPYPTVTPTPYPTGGTTPYPTGGTTPYPTVTPTPYSTPTSSPTTTPAPVGKKKQVPTTGPVL